MEKEFKEGIFRMGRCQIIVTIDVGRWHLSISTPSCSPSYKEIKEARYRFIPDEVVMAQLFPSKREWVNYHPYCHHLWEVRGIEHEPQQ
jgi:hypothetical protein